jgi:hypothetical protein
MLEKEEFIEIEKSDFIGWRFESNTILPFQSNQGFVRFSKYPIESPKINDVITFVSHDKRHYPIAPIFNYEENFKNTSNFKLKLSELFARKNLDGANYIDFLVNVPLEKDGTLRECRFFSQRNTKFILRSWRNVGDKKHQLINQKEIMSGEYGLQKCSISFKVKKGDYFGFRYLSESCVSYDNVDDVNGVYWSVYPQQKTSNIEDLNEFNTFGNRKYSIEVFY